jgi:hypothetical protein
MAKIGLADVDGHNWPNLPLMKLSAWHKARGDEVEPWFGLTRYDRVYKSKVFDFTEDIAVAIMAGEVIEGGTGYRKPVALPPEIEHIYPDYSLYGVKDTAYGFLTRGCPRECPFCIVSGKEGSESRMVAGLAEFWRGQRNIKLLDPNLLAAPEADYLLQQLAASGAWVDFTQGLDIRLVDEARARLLRSVRTKMIHFAWDNPRQNLIRQLIRVKEWLGYDYRKLAVYVLTNYDSTHAEDLYRVETIKRLGYSPYVMIYDKENAPRETQLLQRYSNNKIILRSCRTFKDYDPRKGRKQ